MLPKAEVAVILLNYNCGRFMIPFLESLRKQTMHPKEILMFDNGSSDGSLDIVAKDYPEVKIIRNSQNLGFSFPNNEGIRRTHSEYILLSNLDVVLEPAFIAEMVAPLQQDPRVGSVAGKIYKLGTNGPTRNVDCFAHHMQRDRYANALSIKMPNPDHPYYQEAGVRWGAPACCALYRRRMLEDTANDRQYFDEDFFAYFEDVDLDWRANLHGWKCYYQPSAIAYHLREGTKGLLEPNIMAGFFMNRFFMMVKNDRFQDVLRDIVPILRGTSFAAHRMMKECPQASLYVLLKLRLIPRMIRKRRQNLSRRKASPPDIRKWFN
jgi:GT2 family glycosyltransferase